MKTVNGEYNSAIIMTDDVEDYAVAQVKQLCDLEWMKDSKIICMPDIHPGKVSTVGFTSIQPFSTPIMPALIGNDIGCGVTTVKLSMKKKPDWKKLDAVIRENIPTKDKKRNTPHKWYEHWKKSYTYMSSSFYHLPKASLSLGTLGGGNHFIEVDQDDEGSYYLTIHSGSRSLGNMVYEAYLDVAEVETRENVSDNIARELCCLFKDDSKKYYLEDVYITTKFAYFNRYAMIEDICKEMKWEFKEVSTLKNSVHNTINSHFDELKETPSEIYIRKGAIPAYKNDDIIIPINMKDGIIIGKGKENPDYNFSAPHGSGRIYSRSEVANHHTLNEFKSIMKESGIYSPTISKNTLDEAPFAYRSIDNILPYIQDTVEVVKILKPVYNYKG